MVEMNLHHIHILRSSRRSTPPNAFSLVELLLVLAIIGLLAGAMIPSLSAMLRGPSLQVGGGSIRDHLALARQYAVARNEPVEVRFFAEADEADFSKFAITVPGDVEGGAPSEWLSKIQSVPESVVIDGRAEFSSLLDSAAADGPYALTTSQDDMTPQELTDTTGVAFQFLPSGGTSLGDGEWTITLRSFGRTGEEDQNRPAPNFLTILVNETTGQIKTFQP